MGFRYVGTLCGLLKESVKLNQSNSWALCRIRVRNRDPVGARLSFFFSFSRCALVYCSVTCLMLLQLVWRRHGGDGASPGHLIYGKWMCCLCQKALELNFSSKEHPASGQDFSSVPPYLWSPLIDIPVISRPPPQVTTHCSQRFSSAPLLACFPSRSGMRKHWAHCARRERLCPFARQWGSSAVLREAAGVALDADGRPLCCKAGVLLYLRNTQLEKLKDVWFFLFFFFKATRWTRGEFNTLTANMFALLFPVRNC